MQGIWLLPTRRRPAKLANFFASAIRTGISTPGLILVDRAEYEELKAEYKAIKLPPGWAYYGVGGESVGACIRELWPHTKHLDWVGYLVDDQVCHSYLWDQRTIEHLNGKNFVSTDDAEQYPRRMVGALAFSGELLRTVGFLYPDGLWHAYWDDVWETLGRGTSCWSLVPDVLLTHAHPFNDATQADSTHTHAYSRAAQDREWFAKWEADDSESGRDAIVARIKNMQGA